MFGNLSDREKKLAILVGSLVPLVLGILGFFWFIDKMDSNDAEIQSLMTQLEEQEYKTQAGLRASERQRYYRKISFPSDKGRTRSIYRTWLTDLVTNQIGMTFNGVNFKGDAGVLKYEGRKVGERQAFSLRPKGTLPQLLKFLHAFHSADHLHRINKLEIKPEEESVRGKPKVLTGQLIAYFEIETLQLDEGPENLKSFPKWTKKIPSLDAYEEIIVARNIFGPANNAPSLKKPTKLKFTIADSPEEAEGKYATVQLSATDADKDDILRFEFVEETGKEPEVAGIVMGDQPRTASQRQISIRIPMQSEPMTIPLTVAVADDGMPSKGDELNFSVMFAPPAKEKETPKPQPIDIAAVTFVRGLMRGVDGQWRALVYVQTKSESH